MRAAACALATLAALAAVANASAARSIARPDPVFVSAHLDYVNPIPTLAPIGPAVIAAALDDQRQLAYLSPGDLGGFVQAPVGEHPLSSGGRSLVGTSGRSEIPQFARAAGGGVTSFAIARAGGEGTAAPPDNGRQPAPGLEHPAPFVPPSSNAATPPPNDGFGGVPKPAPAPLPTTTTTRTVPVPAPPPTRVTTTTTLPLPATTTTAAVGPEPAPPPRGTSCGQGPLRIESDRAECRIVAVDMAPGGAASETVTITNAIGEPVALSLRASGSQNRLWSDLRLGVWESGTPAPQPLPPLLWWTTQDNPLTTLQPGESVRYRIELYLMPSAGNDVQALVASIDFVWRATA
jgi:hypothetical protein